MTEFQNGERSTNQHVSGLNAEVFKSFCRLLVKEGELNAVPELNYRGDSSSLFIAEEQPEGKYVYHLYAYPQPYTNPDDGSHHLATLVRVPESTNYADLRYDLHANVQGGLIAKREKGTLTPDIDESEKTELVTRLDRFKDGLGAGDTMLAKQAGW